MKDILDYQIDEVDLENKFNLQREIYNKIQLLTDFGIYGENRANIVQELKECTNQQQLDNVMRKAFHMYL